MFAPALSLDQQQRGGWPLILGGLLTLLMVAGLGRGLYMSGFDALNHAVPTNPLFYLAFALSYLALPSFDYLIFRRLWHIPRAGIAALHKKRIANEVLVGYSGEAYFYAWVRHHAQNVSAPFGAVKDVAILSALAGNLVTLLAILLLLPFEQAWRPMITGHWLAASGALMVLMCLPFLIFSKRLLSLPPPSLWWVFGMHLIRSLAILALSILAWHFAMPQVAMGTWLFFAAMRLLSSRLPLVPNKEMMFASAALLVQGPESALTHLLALCALLTLLCHIVLLAGLTLPGLVRKSA